MFDSEQEMHHRMEVLGKLHGLVRRWIRDLSIQRNMPLRVADTVGGNIYTFGSYRLGVHHRGADIDALCVAPRHVDRTDYFSSFMELLKLQDEVCPSIKSTLVIRRPHILTQIFHSGDRLTRRRRSVRSRNQDDLRRNRDRFAVR